MIYNAPLDDVLRILEISPRIQILQHARQLEIAREQGNTDEAIHQLNLMLRIYHEILQKDAEVLAARRAVRGFLSGIDDPTGECTAQNPR